MKIIHITSLQEEIMKREILKEAMESRFSFEQLKHMRSFVERKKFCDKYLGKNVGRGSSRLVYQIDDTWVLKLAYNQKGVAQNEQEFNFSQENFVDVTPKVYEELSDTENYLFIVSEYVLPAKEEDFNHVFGISFEKFCSVLTTVESYYSRKRFPSYSILSDEEMEELEENSDNLREYVEYVSNYQPPLGDMLAMRNYGLTHRDGESYIVLLDSGLSDEIYNTYYKR